MGFPPVQRHGQLERVFDDIYYVMGTLRMPGALPVAFSRNMIVVKSGDSLTLVNSMRLDDEGLAALDALGKVEHVIRVAGFHGLDDPFYKDRYGAKVWVVEGQRYVRGFNAGKPDTKAYFEPDESIGPDSELPIEGARMYVINTAPPEGILVLPHEGGILVPGDALQNWASGDEYFSFVAKIMMRFMGFIKPHNVGPGWLREAKPKPEEVAGILDLDFNHVLPVHGTPVIGGAKAKYRPAIERVSRG